jgi:hypothetical protein
MDRQSRDRRPRITHNAGGPGAAEAFVIIAIATILLTRLYLEVTGYPQVGCGDLHIAHALYGGALMMLALLIGRLLLGTGARVVGVVPGGIGLPRRFWWCLCWSARVRCATSARWMHANAWPGCWPTTAARSVEPARAGPPPRGRFR